MENLEAALLLMVVGMATAFTILLLVIYLGKLLISLVNRYAPEEQPFVKQGAKVSAPIPDNIIATITAVVDVVTQGKGRMTKTGKIWKLIL